LRLAIVSQPFDGVLPPHQNSLGIWTYEVARRLAERHDVTVYLQANEALDVAQDFDGVHYKPISLRMDHALQRRFPAPGDNPRLPAYARRRQWIGYALQVAWDLRRRQCDVAHVLNFHQFAPTLKLFQRSLHVVLNMRCEWLSQLDRGLIATHLEATDRVIGCSTHVTGLTSSRFPEFADRCQTVPNAIDTENLKPPAVPQLNDPAKLLYIGRVSPEKGVHVLIEAMEKIIATGRKVQLDIIGGHAQLPLNYLVGVSDDPLVRDLETFYTKGTEKYADVMQDRVKAAGLSDCIVFHGQRSYADVVTSLQHADLLINPSLSESFGRGPVEAMACGTPVVCAATGGMVDTVVDGETGRLTAPGDATALADAVVELLDNRERMAAMGAAARRRVVNNYSWDSIVCDLEAVYGELADHG
jgi:glycosyltransferase involved in cell wall biosynthesis